MPNQVAIPQAFVEIYPFEGGKYSIKSGNQALLSCDVTKTLKSDDAGSFSLILAPGGPLGINTGPSWTDIITPVSLVLIGMSRGSHRQIVMIGVATAISEGQQWGQTVFRQIVVTGKDFGYFFTSQSYYTWTFLASNLSALLANNLPVPGAGLPLSLNTGLLSGAPANVAKEWFNTIFAGKSGILAQTSIAYNDSRLLFPDTIATWFQEYPNATIPFTDLYIASEESWMAKFRHILPFPFYEVFPITAPTGFYAEASGGFSFSMEGLGTDIKASPVFVARVNPLPFVGIKRGSDGLPQLASMDLSAWSALPLFLPDNAKIASQIGFTEDEVRNFYALNLTYAATLNGAANGSQNSFLAVQTGAVDITSIHRYGYRPEWSTSSWFADINGNIAQNPINLDISTASAALLTRSYSYFEPTPVMGRASATMELRPDIMPGCKFRFDPFKGEDTWDFYIEGISHRFKFGGPSITELTLSRGLPSSVYADASDNGKLRACHLGTAQRVDGDYEIGIPAVLTQTQTVNDTTVNGQEAAEITITASQTPQGLQLVRFDTSSLNQIQQEAAKIFATAQAN